MTWIDFVILGVIAVSTYWSFRQGFIMEVFYSLSVFLGLLSAFIFYPYLVPLFEKLLEGPDLAAMLTFGGIFLITAVLLVLLGLLCHNFVHFIKLGFFDHLAGALLGFFRAVIVLAVVIVIIVALSSEQKPDYISDSYFCEPVVKATNWTMERVPYIFTKFRKDYGVRAEKWLEQLREE